MQVDKDKFEKVIDNLLKQPPKKRADAKLGRKKSSKTIIPPKTENPGQKQDS